MPVSDELSAVHAAVHDASRRRGTRSGDMEARYGRLCDAWAGVGNADRVSAGGSSSPTFLSQDPLSPPRPLWLLPSISMSLLMLLETAPLASYARYDGKRMGL